MEALSGPHEKEVRAIFLRMHRAKRVELDVTASFQAVGVSSRGYLANLVELIPVQFGSSVRRCAATCTWAAACLKWKRAGFTGAGHVFGIDVLNDVGIH